MTGHDNGLITLHVAEGDDAEREKRRTQLGEPYRTLVGHFRHEIGHYYWDRLVRDGGRLDACRAVFGDERADYGEALQRHYNAGSAGGLARPFHQRLRHLAPLGGFRRDLGALPAHRRCAGDGAQLRHQRARALHGGPVGGEDRLQPLRTRRAPSVWSTPGCR